MKLITLAIAVLFTSLLFASEKVLDCNEGRFHIQIFKQSDDTYSYVAFDQKKDLNVPSLVLNRGKYEETRTGENFSFENQNYNYNYNVFRYSDGRGGKIILTVFKKEDEIFRETCLAGF